MMDGQEIDVEQKDDEDEDEDAAEQAAAYN
jgi:hypothetical protein